MANPLLDSWARKEGALHLEPDEPRERAPRRRRLAFWALCICFACHTVWAHCQFRLTDPMIHWAFVPPRLDGLAPEDGKPYSCYYSYGRHPSSDTRSYTTHFTLPRHAPEHYMFSYSTHVGGAVNFTTHPAAEGAVEDRVQVRVTVESLKNDCPVNICEMHTGGYRPNSTWGVGVFVRRPRGLRGSANAYVAPCRTTRPFRTGRKSGATAKRTRSMPHSTPRSRSRCLLVLRNRCCSGACARAC